MIGYYAGVAEVMLPHLFERAATRKRWPNGVGDDDHKPLVFFTKDLDSGTPDWVPRHKISHRDHDNQYPVVNDLATLTWLGSAGRPGTPRTAVAVRPERPAQASRPTGAGPRPGRGGEPGRLCRGRPLGAGHPRRHRPRAGTGDLRQQGDPPLCRRWTAPELRGSQCRRPGTGARPRSRSPRHGHRGDEAVRAGGQGVHRLEPEQRQQDHRVAVLAAGSGPAHRRRAAYVGGAGRPGAAAAGVPRDAGPDHGPRGPDGGDGDPGRDPGPALRPVGDLPEHAGRQQDPRAGTGRAAGTRPDERDTPSSSRNTTPAPCTTTSGSNATACW